MEIFLTGHGCHYPKTNLRVFTARANSEAALDEVMRQYLDRAADSLESGGSLRVGTLVPQAAVRRIIGRGGEALRRLEDSTGVRVRLRDPVGGCGPHATVEVSVQGAPGEGLLKALVEVHHQVFLHAGELWFPAWAAALDGVVPGGEDWSPAASAGIDLVNRVMDNLPDYVIEEPRGFSTSCIVPERLVEILAGPDGSGTREVQTRTGTQITLQEIPGDPAHRSMTISGPLTSVSAAYILMMRRYLDAERGILASG